jgi:heat shock protein HslJ
VTWRLSVLPGFDAASLAAFGRSPTVRFEARSSRTSGARVAGFAGCNRFSGAYTFAAERLEIGELAATRMACAEPAMSIEAAFLAAFAGSFRIGQSGDRLTLTPDAATGSPALVFVAERPAK